MSHILLKMSRVYGYLANPNVETPGYTVNDRLFKCRIEASTQFSLKLISVWKDFQA